MSSQIKMPDVLKSHLKNKMVDAKIGNFTVVSALGDGNTAVTYKVEDRYQRPWALKIVLSDSYKGRAPIREIVRFARAEDDRFLILPEEFGNWSLDLESKRFDFIWIKSRMVKGETLEKFLESNRTFSSETEVLRYIECITTGLVELSKCGKGYCHGDLHDRNIMRSVIGEGGALPEIRYVIIDFSEAHQIEEVGEGISSDIVNIGKHLRRFSDAIYQKDNLSRDDEKILSAMQHIPGLLNGSFAESSCITKPSEIYGRFKDALIAQEKRATSRTLRTPFDSLSAENIVNDTLLADLCLTGMWWTPELEDNKNVLLIGPRGCGKTMIFRRLRLKTKIGANKFEEISKDKYIAFYLPCESIFFMRFSDLSEVDAERHKDALVLFFNMAIFSEVVSTLKILPDFLGPISKSTYKSLKEILKEELGDVWGKLNLLDILTSFDELYDYSQIAMRHIRKSIAFGEEIHAKGSNDFTSRLVDVIKREIPSLSGRYFVFLLDDYTEERVPISLQEALHPTVSQRSAEVCFKMSAHMFGSIYCYL